MRVAVRTTGMVILALVAAVLLVTSTMTSVFNFIAVASTTALIMGGHGHPLSTPKDTISFIQQYMDMAIDNYISPASSATPPTGIPEGTYNAVAVITPEEGLTLDQSVALGKTNLDNCIKATNCVYNTDIGSTAPASTDTFVVFGYSQSAMIATLEKRSLADLPVGQRPNVSFVLIGNGNRPNGGLLARGPQGFTIPSPLPLPGATFNGSTPNNTQYKTVDITEQYDALSDVPLNPLNLFADANWSMSHVHNNYQNVSLSDPGIVNQGQFGDTTYYLIPTPILPLLMPLEQIPVIGYPLADALDAPLRVLVEAGYNRTISPGQPTPFNPLYFPNPVALAINLLVAIPTGLDNGLQDITGIRPFGTQRPGPYGVGGPEVTYLNPPATTAPTQSAAPTVNGAVPVSLRSPLNMAPGLPSLTNASTVVPDPGAADQSFDALSDGVPVGVSTAAPLPLSGAKLTNDSFAFAATTQSSTGPKPGDGIRAAAVRIQHSLPGRMAVDVSEPDAATTQSSSGRKPGDGIGAVTGPIRQAFSGSAAATSTPIARLTSVTSTETRSAASSTLSSPGNDSTSGQSGRHRAK